MGGYLREIGWEGVDWMNLSQDRNQWWAFVETVMRLRVLWKAQISWLASQEELCFMDSVNFTGYVMSNRIMIMND